MAGEAAGALCVLQQSNVVTNEIVELFSLGDRTGKLEARRGWWLDIY